MSSISTTTKLGRSAAEATEAIVRTRMAARYFTLALSVRVLTKTVLHPHIAKIDLRVADA
jgi:hypothetical protein